MENNKNNIESTPSTSLPSYCEVLIVGGGVAGASSYYSLHKAGVKDVILIDVGQCGQGSTKGKTTSKHSFIREDDIYQGKQFQHAAKSGTAVMDYPTQAIKMMVNIYPCTSKYFISHHGFEGARRYLNLCYQGLNMQTELSKQVFSSEELEQNLFQKGSLQVGEEHDEEEMREEFELLKQLGYVGVEFWNREQVEKELSGVDAKFTCGLYYIHDAIINSQQYSANLIDYVLQNEQTYQLFENSPKVIKTETVDGHALTTLENGITIKSKYVVLCTGGLYPDPTLSGILTPCYSYLISMKEPQSAMTAQHRMPSPNSMNYFTWGFTHDWAMTKGHVRLSGEDHFSALKPPREDERCASLASWIVNRFPYLKDSENDYEKKYGVYSETPDKAPIVGTPSPLSKVCYVVGCNAIGQASLSYSGSLVAALLGYTQLDTEQKDSLKLLTIRRFVLLNEVMKGYDLQSQAQN